MGKVYRDQLVPIPSGARVNAGQKVYEPPRGPVREMLIGYAVSETMMHPNSNYFTLYGQGLSASGSFSPAGPVRLKVGLYALVLGAAQESGIYAELVQAFGIHDANQIMDHVMALLRENKEAIGAMEGEVSFTGMPLPDQISSECLSTPHNKDAVQAVLDQRLRQYVAGGLESVYLVLVGTTGDEDAVDSHPAEPVDPAHWRGLIWAVQANGAFAGLPIPYFQVIDGLLTAHTIQEAAAHFQSFDISIQGILCDEACSTPELFSQLQQTGLPYMVRLRKDTAGFQTMQKKGISRVRNPDDFLGDGLFGFSGSAQVFQEADFSSPAAFFYSPAEHGEKESALMNTIYAAMKKLEDCIWRNLPAVVPSGMEQYLCIEGQGKDRVIVIDEMAISDAIHRLGYTCIATSEEQTARDTRTIYGYRAAADKASGYCSRLLGCDVFQAGTDPRTQMAQLVSYVAALLWYYLQQTSTEMGKDLQEMLQDMRDIQYQLVQGAYRLIPLPKFYSVLLLADYGINPDVLKDFEGEVSRRYGRPQDQAQIGDVYNVLPWDRTSASPSPDGERYKNPES